MAHALAAVQERNEWLLKNMGKGAAQRAVMVAAFPRDEDRHALEAIIGPCQWDVAWCGTCAAAIEAVERTGADIVMSGGAFPDGEWRDLWSGLRRMAHPPTFIVASRLADEAMWAEVLNLGAYNLLLKPFRSEEVVRTVHGALLAHRGTRTMAAGRPEPCGCLLSVPDLT